MKSHSRLTRLAAGLKSQRDSREDCDTKPTHVTARMTESKPDKKIHVNKPHKSRTSVNILKTHTKKKSTFILLYMITERSDSFTVELYVVVKY